MLLSGWYAFIAGPHNWLYLASPCHWGFPRRRPQPPEAGGRAVSVCLASSIASRRSDGVTDRLAAAIELSSASGFIGHFIGMLDFRVSMSSFEKPVRPIARAALTAARACDVWRVGSLRRKRSGRHSGGSARAKRSGDVPGDVPGGVPGDVPGGVCTPHSRYHEALRAARQCSGWCA